jgi:acyl-CoA synthetase (NDP forming)
VHDLTKFFHPASVALVGVSTKMTGLGGISYLDRLTESGFAGRLYPINPTADGEILGRTVYPSLSALPEVPELVMVFVAAARIPAILEECARIGVRHIHILSSGFREVGTPEGAALDDRIATIAAEKDLLVMGPNCMGPYCPSHRLTPWGAIPGRHGPLGIISQSGMVTQRLTEYAFSLGVGVDKAASIGNATVLDVHDYLEYMAADEGIRVIAMYLESVRDGRRLLQVAKDVNRRKPIVFLKGGESEAGASTVASHTGRMAGEQRLWDAFFRQSGVARVRSTNEWMDAVLAFCRLPKPEGKGLFIIGGGGGNSVIHGDTCIREGLEVPRLSPASLDRLRPLVPAEGNIAGNPLDFGRAFFDAECLGEVLEIGYQDPAVDAIIVDRLIPRNAYHMPEMPDATDATIDHVRANGHRKPTVFMVDSDGGDLDLATKGTALLAKLCAAGIPTYPSLERAARALLHLRRYHEHLDSMV